jgi:hypothetical protein
MSYISISIQLGVEDVFEWKTFMSNLNTEGLALDSSCVNQWPKARSKSLVLNLSSMFSAGAQTPFNSTKSSGPLI